MDEEDSSTSTDSSSDDPIIHQIPVFLTKESLNNIYLLQYPLHPAHLPYNGDSVLEAKIKPKWSQLELTMSLDTRGQNFSRSKGEQLARSVETEGNKPYFSSGIMDRQVLISNVKKEKQESKLSRYVIGVYKDNQLHLTALNDIIQLRPSLKHIELKHITNSKTVHHGGLSDGGDTTATESEDEAKPVTVKFARPGVVKSKVTFESEEPWISLKYNSLESTQATEERLLLFANDDEDNQSHSFSISSHDYLNMICPVVTDQISESPPGPSDVLSLTQLKALPKDKQVIELMKKAMVLPFDQICTMLGRGKTERGPLLDDIRKCSLLVQGCWVVHSALIFPKESSHLRNARDYILWCFTQNSTLTRKDLAGLLKITTNQLRDILQPIASYKPGNGWEFRTLDREFIVKYPQIVTTQQDYWHRRHNELIHMYGIGASPESAASKQTTTSQENVVVSGADLVKSATQRAKQKMEAAVDSTPVRPHPLQPTQLLEDHEISVKSMDALKTFCKKTVGRGVVSFSDIKDRLLIHQSSSSEDDPLRGHGITSEMIEKVLKEIGCVAVGLPSMKRYALKEMEDDTDQYRQILLELFSTAKSVRKKQMVEAITNKFSDCNNKLLTTTLRDLCTSRGATWYLKGTT